MVATPDYLDWLAGFAEHLGHLEVSDAVREVLRKAADRSEFRAPPMR